VVDRAEQMLARAQRHSTEIALMFVDLDGFKDVNDSLGHHVGDQILKAVAIRFSAVIRDTDTVGRLGGDEFVVLTECARARRRAPRWWQNDSSAPLSLPFDLGGDVHVTDLNLGEHRYCDRQDARGVQELLRDADIALYAAKGRGQKVFGGIRAEHARGTTAPS
jgi:diguanylate cyclase (GGDEF)-like protein